MKNICEVCEGGFVIEVQKMLDYEYLGNKTELPLYYKHCDYCGSDYAGSEETKKNSQQVLNFRCAVDRISEGLK